MHKYESVLLNVLKKGKWVGLNDALKASRLKKDKLLWAVENLSSTGAIDSKRQETERIELSEEGKKYSVSGMPEELLLSSVSKGEVSVATLSDSLDQIGLQWAKKKGLVVISKGRLELTNEGKTAIRDGVEEGNALRELSSFPDAYSKLKGKRKEALQNLLKRGLIRLSKKNEIEGLRITEKGLKALESDSSEQIDELDRSMIMSRSWKDREFKPYNVTLEVEKEQIALRHPVKLTIRKIMEIYLSLGFVQITGPIIEPAFWVFDSLFVPQDHPARDLQDTFYLSNPERIDLRGEKSIERIKKAHLESWGGEWKAGTAEQALLRTHTTNISVRQINRIVDEIYAGKGMYQLPLKFFSVGRVFRNENIDYRHLTDFYQHEGIVIGRNLTLANLFDILVSIYKPLGLELRFRPSYFPFVEPGTEFYAYSGKSKEWIEMGGAGIIRREVTGVSRRGLTVLAWGPGLERIMLLKDPGIKSITELYNNDLGWLRKRRMV